MTENKGVKAYWRVAVEPGTSATGYNWYNVAVNGKHMFLSLGSIYPFIILRQREAAFEWLVNGRMDGSRSSSSRSSKLKDGNVDWGIESQSKAQSKAKIHTDWWIFAFKCKIDLMQPAENDPVTG